MTPTNMVQTVMAGGVEAFFTAIEGTEDDEDQGQKDMKERQITKNDVVVGITASGRTPYPIGALKYAREIGAYTVSLCCNLDSLISKYAYYLSKVTIGPDGIEREMNLQAKT